MPNEKVKKAYEMTDARIHFVSLVHKAANKRKFLVTKSDEEGKANVEAFCRIVSKSDNSDVHYVTGVVYEPMAEDTDGNYMTASEVEKAAHYFFKHGAGCDLQHDEEVLDSVNVVESWVEKSDTEIGGEPVKKGTWLITAEIADDKLWDDVQKGDITGFSMGGIAYYSEIDTDISDEADDVSKSDKGVLDKIKEILGMGKVEKGAVKDNFNKKTKSQLFWNAWYSLCDVLEKWDWSAYEVSYEEDKDTIKDALSDFNDIVTDILANEKYVAKSIKPVGEVKKAGKKMSNKNKETLNGIYESLGEFIKGFDEPEEKTDSEKEEVDMTKEEIQKMIKDGISEAMNAKTDTVSKSDDSAQNGNAVTMDDVRKMVKEAVTELKKAEGNAEGDADSEAVTPENIAKMVKEEVAAAFAPIQKQVAMPSNLNSDGEGSVEKSDEHYLHGVF